MRYGCAPSPYSISVGAFPSMDLHKETWQGGDAVMPSLSGPLLLHSYHVLAGIRAAETLEGAGFRNFSIMPSPVSELLWVNASHDSPLGTIAVSWFVVPPPSSAPPGAPIPFHLQVVIPPGASAVVGIPTSPASSAAAAAPAGKRRWAGDRTYVQVGSGTHSFTSTL
jgi:hypothetical protein